MQEKPSEAHCIESDDFGLAGHVGKRLDGHRLRLVQHCFVHLSMHAGCEACCLCGGLLHMIKMRRGSLLLEG